MSARRAQPLGDSHNFGRRVSIAGDRVHKPRAIAWEELLLSRESPLRRFFEHAAKRDAIGGAGFSFLPNLRFFPDKTQIGGAVERVKLAPLPKLSPKRKRELAAIVGRAIALFTWLGVSDLHWENLVLGVASDARIVFAPLDVEMILADLASPTETKLVPDADPEYADVCRHAAGVRRVLPYLGKPLAPAHVLAIAKGYLAMLAFLDRHAQAIAEVITKQPNFQAIPIRVCLRGTGDYVRAQRGARDELWPPLLAAEEEQLARGDIPYFFRLYDRAGIHYFADASLRRWKTLPKKGDVPQLDRLLSLARGFRSPNRKKLHEEGLFALLGAFDDASLEGRHADGDLDIAFRARTIVVARGRGKSREELISSRNLSAFVGSVYLPCRCGEVRAVFVPDRTTCASAI